MQSNVKHVQEIQNKIKYRIGKDIDIVQLLINAIPAKAKQFGNSIYLHIPSEIIKDYKIEDKDIVRIVILSVEKSI